MLEALRLLLSKITDPTPQIQPVTLEDGSVYVAYHQDHKLSQNPGPKASTVNHEFGGLESFAEYLNRAKRLGLDADRVDILVNKNRGVAYLGPTAHAFDVLTVKVPETVLWENWKNGKSRMDQGQFLAFLRAYGSCICDAVNGEGKVVCGGDEHLIGLIRKLQVSKETNFNTEYTKTGDVKLASADQKTTLSLTIPESFEVELPIYEGIDAPIVVEGQITGWMDEPAVYRMKVLLTVDTSDGLAFSLSIPTKDQAVIMADAELCAFLGYLLDDSFLVSQGTAKTTLGPVHAIARPLVDPTA